MSMLTRARGRRQDTANHDAPPKIADARQTRQASATAATSKTTSGRAASALRTGSLANDPVPVRNARRGGEAKSIASIPTSPDSIDGESEAAEEESGNEPTDEQFGTESGDIQDMTVRYQIMESLLPDLKRATHELKQRLEDGNSGHEVSAVILQAKRGALCALMEACQKPGQQSPFIDFAWLESLPDRQDVVTRAAANAVARASAQANVVLVLDFVQQTLLERPTDVLSFLQALDVAFPRLLTVAPEDQMQNFDLALAIRTQLFIKTLAAQTGQVDADAVIASVFYANDDNSLSGPFKGLSGIDEIKEGSQEWTDIRRRTQRLAAIISESAEDTAPEKLGEEYALNTLLEHVGEWCVEEYTHMDRLELDRLEAASNSSADEPVSAGIDEFQDAQESFSDSQTEGSIMRRPSGEEKKRSLMDSKDNDLAALGSRGGIQGLRSGRTRPLTPSDFGGVPTEALLTESGIQNHYKRKRRASNDGGGGHVESDDDFETDTRQNKNPDQVRAQPRASKLPTEGGGQALPSRGPAIHVAAPTNRPSQSLASARFPYPNTPNNPNWDNVLKRKAHNLHSNSHRPAGAILATTTSDTYNSSAPPPYATARSYPAFDDNSSSKKRRQKWSLKDSATLLELIALENARWSVIEKQYNHRFEIPRDQQAYRDRARNLKVDFLLADAILPPGFDLVVLGKKEVEKVLAGGRNPDRKEHDIDDDGQVINTLR
ncbi:hypothetical protein E4U53_008025 [Claviceps sorghi]|nr:hypothetical protein E4U53_008025 [Claviceps sorghi]